MNITKCKSINKTMVIGKEPEQKAQGDERGAWHGELDCLKKLLEFSELPPLSGHADFNGLSEEELVERIRMKHYGY